MHEFSSNGEATSGEHGHFGQRRRGRGDEVLDFRSESGLPSLFSDFFLWLHHLFHLAKT